MNSSEESLAGIPLFESLTPADLDDLRTRCQWRRFASHQEIVRYLDDTADVFFLVKGQVRAVFYSRSGKEVTFRDIGPGQVFGEFAAIDNQPRSATIIALEDSLVAVMSAETFRESLRQHPAAAEYMMKRLVALARRLSDRVVEFSTLAVRNRIHAELLRLARRRLEDGNVAVIAPAPTHADIASRVSTHREAVTRELNALDRQGLIERTRDSLIIRDVDELARIVEEVSGEPARPQD
ncbi:MAG: Crp/Fnr family transcriptional regulator [Alphaproteobacteria bacterium]|nr:Crp/Fnr family transcriptional regulator [Alphaproteobacteria bacterium]